MLFNGRKKEIRTREFGASGENIASNFLQKQGYCILAKNYRCRLGEVDLVARDGKTLAFVEIKFRHGTTYGLPQEAVTYRKQRKIVKVALHYLKKNHSTLLRMNCPPVRFDVVAILPEGIELIKNAFPAPQEYTL